jgi:flagellar basal body P-ring formation protein FlgA
MMIKNFFVFVLSLLLPFVSVAEIQKPSLSIQSRSEVTAGLPIRLKDIGTVEYVMPEQAHQVLETVLFEPLEDQKTKQVRSSEVIRVLKDKMSELTELKDKWTYFIPETVVIVAKKNAISESALKREIIWSLQEKCRDCTQISVRDLKVPKISTKENMTDWLLETDQLKISNSFLIPMQAIFANSRETYWISGTMKAKKRGPVTLRQIPAGHRITEQDFKLDEVDITFAKDSLPTDKELIGQSLTRTISLGQPIFRGDLKKELAVLRGQQITAVLGNEIFEVSAQMQAEEQGYVGDIIKIKSQEGKKVFSGQITDKGVVRIK